MSDSLPWQERLANRVRFFLLEADAAANVSFEEPSADDGGPPAAVTRTLVIRTDIPVAIERSFLVGAHVEGAIEPNARTIADTFIADHRRALSKRSL